MPRNISAGLKSTIESEAFEPAILVLLTRKDGVKFGFTDSDQPISFGGDDYEPSDGLASSAMDSAVGTGVDNSEFAGVLTSDRITEVDIVAGLYNGARVQSMLVDRNNLASGAMVLQYGFIGEITLSDGQFRAEFRSLSALLKGQVGELTSKTCTCPRLGDACCKVNLAGTTVGGTPNSASKTLFSGSGTSITFSADSAPTGHYSRGVVRFTSGPNTGIEREIKSHVLTGGKAVLVMRHPFPFAVSPGDVATLEAGCDRLFSTCDTKFGNANNFHGQHLLPGNDQILKVGRPPR